MGTDYAGPLFIKDPVDISKNLKAYILIFVCATTRNIHLELLNNMETEVFLQGLRRFVSRRGTPSLLVSDNAQTFKSAKQVLLFIYEHESVQRYLSYKQIEWKFILSKSPWWGDFMKE